MMLPLFADNDDIFMVVDRFAGDSVQITGIDHLFDCFGRRNRNGCRLLPTDSAMRSDDTCRDCCCGCCRAGADTELGEYLRDMALRGARADEQGRGNLSIRSAENKEPQHVEFSRGERLQSL